MRRVLRAGAIAATICGAQVLLGCAGPTVVQRVPATHARAGAELLSVRRAAKAPDVDDALRDADEAIALSPILEDPGAVVDVEATIAWQDAAKSAYRMAGDGEVVLDGQRVAKLLPGDTVVVRGPAEVGDVDVEGHRYVRQMRVDLLVAGAMALGAGAVVALVGGGACHAESGGGSCGGWAAAVPAGAVIGLPLLLGGLVGRPVREEERSERPVFGVGVVPTREGAVGSVGFAF